jgi:predicted Co/Zn/Cd cation transporter (cation efflux family)
MEQNVNVWKANLTNGLILALIGIVYTLVMYFLDLTLNKTQSYVFMVVMLVVLYFLLKSYRDNIRHGQITFGESVGAGVVIGLYYSVIMAVFTYILYTVIDPGLIAKQLVQAEEAMRAKGNLTESQIEGAMKFTQKIMKPGIMVFTGIFFGMLWATVISLLVSIFIRKEGNPLLDTPEN